MISLTEQGYLNYLPSSTTGYAGSLKSHSAPATDTDDTDNGSVFTKEGLGYLLTFDHLIDTSDDSGLVFRPLSPKLETKIYLTWNKYQAFTPIAERFLQHTQKAFADF